MTPGQCVREKLPECGDCVNCKLVIWSTETDYKKIRGSSSVEDEENNDIHFTVQCNWLKSSVPQPKTMLKCEGKRPHSNNDSE